MAKDKLRAVADKYGVIARRYEQNGKTEYLFTIPMYKAEYIRWRRKYRIKKFLTFKQFDEINEAEEYLQTIPEDEVKLNIIWLKICRQTMREIFGDDAEM